MKIVISSYTFLPEIGGVATNVSVLARAFHDLGHEVTVVTTAKGRPPAFPYTVIQNPDPLTLFRLYKTADLLILSNLSLKLLYPLLFIDRPFALRHHSESAFRLGNSKADRLKKRIRDRAVHFMTSDYIGRMSGLKNYYITHPFANPAHITADVVKPIKNRKSMVFVGRLTEEKGILWLLERWGMIREKLDISELRIVGDGKLRAETERYASADPSIKVLGALPLSETAKEMGAAIYSIIPSLWAEPFGAVATESLAAGAITLHTDRGGLPETTGRLGFHFNPDLEKSTIQALENAKAFYAKSMASEENYQAYLQEVRNWLTNFSPEMVATTIINAFHTEETTLENPQPKRNAA